MKLKEIAHSRAGDKGNVVNISIIPYNDSDYPLLKERLTSAFVKDFFQEICYGTVTRYEVDSICSLNFVLTEALDGGVTRSMAIDKHGKSFSMALLEAEI